MSPGWVGCHPNSSRARALAELQERELIKLAALAAAIAGVPRRRGVTHPAASLTTEAGIAVFRIAFERFHTVPTCRNCRISRFVRPREKHATRST